MELSKEFLDKQEVRKANIEKIKQIIFDLCYEEYNCMVALTNLGPHRPICKQRLEEIPTERTERIQDYEAFMYDFSSDWNFNFNDYKLD